MLTARARERCSRGSPCRRCAIKSLYCLYPEEHQFKTMTPYTWSSSASDSGDYEAPGVGWLGSQSPLGTTYTGNDALLQGLEPSQWQVESSSVPYGGLPTYSALSHSRFHPYQSGPLEFRLPPSVRHNGPSLRDAGPYLGSTSRICTDDMKLVTGGAELEGMLGAYEQTINMPFHLNCSSRMSLQQYSPSTEFQDHPVRGPPFDSRPPTAPFDTRYIHGSSSGIDTTMVGEPETLNFEYVTSAQAPSIGVDSQETLSQYLQTPYSNTVDSKSHDFITTTSREPCQGKTAAIPFESTTTSTGMNHQDINSHTKPRHDCFSHCGDNDGLEEAGGQHICFESLYTQ
ncbi:hypothetical protein GGR58DRAFT_163912 [Xylaria digitata]|nr:hypothetical protein GGR58DRAFT_163912 [Xylaria digitata]